MTTSQKLTVLSIYIMGGLYFYFTMPVNMADREVLNYSILLVAYVVVGALGIIEFSRKSYYIFEPFSILFCLYFIIMILRPLIDIKNSEFLCHGKDVMDGCFKGTIIFIISFMAMQFGYHAVIRSSEEDTIYYNSKPIQEYDHEYTPRVRHFCIFLWGLGFCFAILYYIITGRNPIGALTLGLVSSQDTMGYIDSSVKFLMKLAFVMIIPWIYIMRFDKSILLKLVTTVLMFLHFLAMGSRYILVVVVVGWLLVPYICERKTFSFRKGVLIFAILLVAAGAIGFFRGDVKAGGRVDMTGFSVEDVFYVFDSDFTIYRAYYCVVDGIPRLMDYQLGKGLIGYTLTSFIPSVIFPYKRVFDNVALIVTTVVNERAGMSGIAYINLGQFYAEFGVAGCIICMFIFGAICRRIRRLYCSEQINLNKIILYSVLFPFLMQVVIRGDLAQQLNSLICILASYYAIKWFGKRQTTGEIYG